MNTNTRDYSSTNASLDRLMSSDDIPAAAGETISKDSANQTLPDSSQNTGSGTLIAQVSVANGAVPIMGANVIISNTDGSLITTQFTDNSGRTPGIRLPAPSSEYSLHPGNLRPYSTYNMRVEYPGFYTEEFLNIAIFDKIVSVQPVSMEPLGEDATENDRLIIINEDTNS